MKWEERIAWIEDYYERRLSEEEERRFEQLLETDKVLQKEWEDYCMLRRSMDAYWKAERLRKNIRQAQALFFAKPKQPLEKQEEAAFSQSKQLAKRKPKVWHYHLSSMLIAASVAAVVTVFAINFYKVNTLEVKQQNYYQALKRDIDKIREQNASLSLKAQREDDAEAHTGSRQVHTGATAFLFSPEGYVLTTYHAVEDARTMRLIQYRSEDTLQLNAALIYFDKHLDLALLKIEDSAFRAKDYYLNVLRLMPGEIDLGEEVFTLAYPREDLVYGVGAVSAHTGYEGDTLAYEISIPVNPGNSGSPLFDAAGRLVGIVTGKHTQAEGAAFAVKSTYIWQFLQRAAQADSSFLLGHHRLTTGQYAPLRYYKRPAQIKALRPLIFELKTYSQSALQ
jgi:S1-C subfamily serine protease